MGFIDWLKGLMSKRGKALARYRSGMIKANGGDYSGAIHDYSAAIESPVCPMDVRGMAIYNRALSYAAIHQEDKAADDLAALLEMPELPENIKAQAHQRRERLRRRADKSDG